ncbi:sodium:proton antiporter [Beijerinckia sp. L45]|uniref:cation:proton antiporter n=1 Tax=Beijerinckia sp. L45 TaxID=1641855 RepID=UPI001FEEB309|nr:sodium:proton antiporter [Beijerinckia sp. L45]
MLAAVFSYLNARFIKLPQTIGLTILGAILSALVIAVGRMFPQLGLIHAAQRFVDGLDFRTTLLDGMLSFLLFAGAFQIDLAAMRGGRWAILVLSSVGTVLSTVIVGFAFKLLLSFTGPDLPLIWCFVFGALISPTDPVAVIAILRKAVMPPTIQATVAAESLFNDGVGVVVFSIVFAAASGAADLTLGKAAGLFALEAGGGIVFGLGIGALAFYALRGIDDYVVEVLITLAAVMGGYAVAQAAGVSGPVAMAVAGLILGNHGLRHALHDATKEHVIKFWELIDEILNAVLFLLVGLEAITVWTDTRIMLVALAAIPIVLLARLVSVALPLALLHPFESLGRGALPILWWGGLRGGISIALALSIPAGPGQPLLLAATYAVVLFSVLVQGATIGRVAGRYRVG